MILAVCSPAIALWNRAVLEFVSLFWSLPFLHQELNQTCLVRGSAQQLCPLLDIVTRCNVPELDSCVCTSFGSFSIIKWRLRVNVKDNINMTALGDFASCEVLSYPFIFWIISISSMTVTDDCGITFTGEIVFFNSLASAALLISRTDLSPLAGVPWHRPRWMSQ